MTGDERTGPEAFFAGCFAQTAAERRSARIAFAGLADASQSSLHQGPARAPERIRRAYTASSYNSTSESGVDLARAVRDFGDFAPAADWNGTAARFEQASREILRQGLTPFFAGGDHAVSVPVLAAAGDLQQPIHIIQIDAHPDLYPEFEGSRTSHACVAARLLEMEHVASITQLGIRTLNSAQQRVADAHPGRVHMFHARELSGELPALDYIPPGAAVWFDFDLDGFDPAFAPGVSHAVPGGLTSRQALNFIQGRRWNLAGMSVVEVNPEFDEHDRTAALAARLLHEAMALVRRE